MESLKWLLGVFSPKGKAGMADKSQEERDREILCEYEVLTSMKERAEQVIQLAKESPNFNTSSERLENVSLSFPPSLIQEPISSRTLNGSGTWRLAVDSSGRYLYSTNNEGLGAVTVYDLQRSEQEPLRSFHCQQIYKVRGIAVGGENSNGEDGEDDESVESEASESFVFVTGDHMVHKYTQEGQFLNSFGSCSPGSDESHCNDPNGLRIYKDAVYVCDSLNERILVLSLDLEYRGSISNKRRVETVVLHEDQVDSPASDAASIDSDQPDIGRQQYVENESGEEQTDAGLQPAQQHQQRCYGLLECSCLDGVCPLHPYLKHPEDLVFDSKGNLHVIDSGKASITVFDPSLRFQRFIQLPVSELPFPVSMCLFADSYYIADNKLGHVVVVSMLGSIQHKFAVQSQEEEMGGFVLIESRERQSPLGLGMDNTGLIYVSNTRSDQIWVY